MKPYFVTEPADVSVREGEDVTLQCQVQKIADWGSHELYINSHEILFESLFCIFFTFNPFWTTLNTYWKSIYRLNIGWNWFIKKNMGWCNLNQEAYWLNAFQVRGEPAPRLVWSREDGQPLELRAVTDREQNLHIYSALARSSYQRFPPFFWTGRFKLVLNCASRHFFKASALPAIFTLSLNFI